MRAATDAGAARTEPRPRRRTRLGRWRLRVLGPQRSTTIGLAILVAFALAAIFAPLLAPYPPTQIIAGTPPLSPPSLDHWFGTDANGMDVLSRTIHATRLDFGIVGVGITIAFLLGGVLGLLAGYRQGWYDAVLLRVGDVLQAFPPLIFGLALLAVSRGSLVTVILVIGVLDAPAFMRLVRNETVRVRRSGFVEAARAIGNPTGRLLRRHIVPNTMPPLFYQGAVRFAFGVKLVAGLAFVGVGIAVPTPEWGAMINSGTRDILRGVWWTSMFPGAALMLLALGFNLLADGLQARFDPARART